MDLAATLGRSAEGSSSLVAELFRREPLFASLALVFAVLIPPTLAAMAFDSRTLQGANVWVKPLKFEISLLLYVATLAWFAGWLPRGVVTSAEYRAFAWAVTAAIVAEMIWVGGAAAFGVASHFNTSSRFMANIYGLMGILAVLLTSASLVYGVIILRDGASPLDPVFKLSVGLGLILTFVLTVVVAGHMASRTGHSVGAGDLRVAHFFATHAMHVIPVFGLFVAAVCPISVGLAAVALFSASYTAFTIWTFVAALMGRPFLGNMLSP
jgi:hypothetical protein